MKRIFAVLLIVFLMLPLCTAAFAAGETEGSLIPDDAFESLFMEYRHDDGSVTMTYRDGSVGTKYEDGSFEGVDGNGNRHTKDRDGTYTVYGTDGSIAVERPDGTQELTEKNGRKTVVNPDGSGKTVFANGLVIEHDGDYIQTAAYFEGGGDRLRADKNGEFPEGEIRGKNGEILKNTENGLYLKGANGVEYELDTEKDTSSITLPDGGTVKTEGENGEIRFADGALFTMTGGQSKFTGADGSFVYIDKNTSAWEMFNADDGTHVKIDEAGEISEMYQETDGNVLRIENGQLTEWKDAEAGVTIRCDENGTTVETPEGTYFTDGKGTVTKDGKPLNAEEEQTQNGKKPAPELSDKYDDSYCSRSFDGDSLWMSTLSSNDFYGRRYDSENGLFYYDWVHQIWDEKHKQLYVQEKYDMTVSMKNVVDHRGEWLDSMGYNIGVADFSTDYLETQYKTIDDIPTYDGASRMNIKVDGYDAVYIYQETISDGDGNGVMPSARNSGTIYVPIVDAPNQYGEVNTLVINCILHGESHELYNAMKGEYMDLIRNLPCQITIRKDSQEFKKLKDAYEEQEEEDDSGVVPYHGRLTYTNGGTNKYGQPWPDLMDFDGDGDIDYADRQIQHVLVHNPDAMDTPEGFALVMTAVLAALAGAGGGSAFGILSGSLGSAGSGLNLNLDFSGEGDEETGRPAGSDQSSGGKAEDAPPAQEDLGPYISRDADGDLNVRDPATGENRLYTANGDGTYTNPLTGATYTEQELKDSLDSRAENASLIRQDEEARERAVSEQREENEKRSQFGIDIEKQAKEELERQNAEIEHASYVEGLESKYGEEGKELKKAIMKEQINAEVEGNRQMAKEAYLEAGQKTAESTEKAADVAIDVLAEVTGEEGKAIKDAYTFTKSTLAKGAEAYAEGRSVTQGMVHGAIEGAVSVGQNHVDGAANKLAANVGGEMFKTALDATAKGEKVDFAKVAESGGMAALNTAVDVGFDLAGDAVKGVMGDSAEKVLGSVFETEVTKGALADGAKALADDLTKEGVGKAFEMPEND